jgi:hypothetical protein
VDRPCVTQRTKNDSRNLGFKLSKGKRLIISRSGHRAIASRLLEKLLFCVAKNEGKRPGDVTPVKRGFKLARKAVNNTHNLKPFRLGNLKFQLLGEAL